MKFRLFKTAFTLFAGVSSLSLADTTPNPSSSLPSLAPTSLSELYLGSIRYDGGLLERGTLTLGSPVDARFIRLEVPSFCQAEVFEAGTVTEGIPDLATPTGTPGIYAVAQGRGMRVRSIFASINGPDQAACHILVFARSDANQPARPDLPPADEAKSVVCIINELAIPLNIQTLTDNFPTQFALAPRSTKLLSSPLRADRTAPTIVLTYDMDLSFAYQPAAATLATAVQSQESCVTAPT
jgi:hypothetical protein